MATIQEELEQIRKATGAPSVGLLQAEDVHEFARTHPDSAIHRRLPWDNDAAAHQWRLHLIRNIIRVSVTMLPNRNLPIRAYVSLTTDRRKEGGGYSFVPEVLSDEVRRRQMLDDALAELNRIQLKYAAIKELSAVFDAIAAVTSKVKGLPKAPAPKAARTAV